VVGSHRGRVQDDHRVLAVLVDSLGELRMQRSGAVMAAAWFSTAMGKMSKGGGGCRVLYRGKELCRCGTSSSTKSKIHLKFVKDLDLIVFQEVGFAGSASGPRRSPMWGGKWAGKKGNRVGRHWGLGCNIISPLAPSYIFILHTNGPLGHKPISALIQRGTNNPCALI
jgi:hypothetical protein